MNSAMQDLAAVREAQASLMDGPKAPLRAVLKSTTLPDSVVYLHTLLSEGQGDSYNYYDNRFVVRIQVTDRRRYPQLEGVMSVMLEYTKGVS